jgi:hypothetical protein
MKQIAGGFKLTPVKNTTQTKLQNIIGTALCSLVPSLADILGAKGRLKSPKICAKRAPASGPRTFLDDIRTGSFKLRQVA